MEESRKTPRCPIHWRSALDVEVHGKRETIQCRTNDISITGVSVICHQNIAPPRAVTVYLLIDPGSEKHPQVIVEAQGQIRNNVLSGQQGGFRLGIEFTKFARDGKQVLTNHLPQEMKQSARIVAPPPPPPPAPAPAQAEAPPQEAVPEAAVAPDEAPDEVAAPAEEAAPPAGEPPAQP